MEPFAYERLAQACARRGLWLELHAGSQLRGATGHEYRQLEWLVVRSGNGRQVLASGRLAGGFDGAAQRVLDGLGERGERAA